MAQEKPKIFEDGRDMFYSVAVIVIVMVIAVGFTGMCTFERDTADNSHVQEVDAEAFLSLEARGAGFPVRYPATPADWKTNSARRGSVGEKQAEIVGWVLHRDGYIQLSQTDATVEEIIDDHSEMPMQEEDSYQVAGETVRHFTSDERDVRDVRIVDLQDVRLAISGAATDEEFNDFIELVIGTQPLPAGAE